MVLKTAKICKEKDKKRVCHPVETFDVGTFHILAPDRLADCSGFSVLKDMVNLPA